MVSLAPSLVQAGAAPPAPTGASRPSARHVLARPNTGSNCAGRIRLAGVACGTYGGWDSPPGPPAWWQPGAHQGFISSLRGLDTLPADRRLVDLAPNRR